MAQQVRLADWHPRAMPFVLTAQALPDGRTVTLWLDFAGFVARDHPDIGGRAVFRVFGPAGVAFDPASVDLANLPDWAVVSVQFERSVFGTPVFSQSQQTIN